MTLCLRLWKYKSPLNIAQHFMITSWSLHILKTQYLIEYPVCISLSSWSVAIIWLQISLCSTFTFYPISSCLRSQEIKLSSSVSFINVNIISLQFIKFQVAVDEAIAGGDSEQSESIFNSSVYQCINNADSTLKVLPTKHIHGSEECYIPDGLS